MKKSTAMRQKRPILAEMLQEKCLTTGRSQEFVKQFFETIVEGLQEDGIVKITGLGTFRVKEVSKRKSVNIQTGKKFQLKSHKQVCFTPCSSLQETLKKEFVEEPIKVLGLDGNHLAKKEKEAKKKEEVVEESWFARFKKKFFG